MSATATPATATVTATDAAERKAISALKTFARSPKQTFAVCSTVHAATVAGVSIRRLADNWETKAAGFSSARVGHFAKTYSRVLSSGLTLTGTDAECNLMARMLTAVSGGSTGIKSATLDAMCESAAAREIDAQTFANELAAESDSHEMTKAASAQDDAEDSAPDDATDTETDAASAPRAETALAFLQRLAATISADTFDADTLAAISDAAQIVAERAELAALAARTLATV